MRHTTCVHIAPGLDSRLGGITSSLFGLCQGTEAAGGYRNEIVAFCGRDEADASPTAGATRFPAGRLLWYTSRALRTRLRKRLEPAGIIHIHGVWTEHCSITGRLARQSGTPYLVSAHGMLESWALRQKRYKKAWYSNFVERPNLQSAACLRALTLQEVADYRAFGLRNPIVLIPNPAPVRPQADASIFFARRPELAGKRIVLFMSRIHTKKGLDILCRAWAAIHRDFPDAHLVIAGPDSDGTLERTVSLARTLRIESSVTFTGMLAGVDKWSALSAANVFILPSYSEGFSMAILEALSAGCPVIATRACNFPDIAGHHCGWLIDPDPVQIQAALIGALHCSDESRRERGLAGQALVARQYTPDRIGRQFTEVYDWLLGGPRPASVQIF